LHTNISGRPQFPQMMEPESGLPKGIIMTDGKVWMEQRRFVLKTLRDFGFGKKSMESLVHDEVTELIESLKKDVNKPIHIDGRFNIAVFNALWTIVAGERYSHSESKVQQLIHGLSSSMEDTKVLGMLMSLPFLSKIMPEFSGLNEYARNNKPIFDFMREIIADHKKTFQSGNNRDLLDCYLEQMNETTDANSSFYQEEGESQLVMTLYDIFLGGTETTSYTLMWMFLLLARHSDVQEKLHEEIENVVGDARFPSLSDKANLPYLEAVIMELMRFSSLSPIIPRRAVEDVELRGYFIPKGTSVYANLYELNFDPKIWGDPENFRPSRFLNEFGKIVKNEALIPFGYGRRFCLGESLARDQIFLFTASLFQRFKVNLGPDNKSENIETVLGAQMRIPKPERLVFQDRCVQ